MDHMIWYGAIHGVSYKMWRLAHKQAAGRGLKSELENGLGSCQEIRLQTGKNKKKEGTIEPTDTPSDCAFRAAIVDGGMAGEWMKSRLGSRLLAVSNRATREDSLHEVSDAHIRLCWYRPYAQVFSRNKDHPGEDVLS